MVNAISDVSEAFTDSEPWAEVGHATFFYWCDRCVVDEPDREAEGG